MERKKRRRPRLSEYIPLVDVGPVLTGIGKHQRLVMAFTRSLGPPNPTGPQVCDGCPIFNPDQDHIPPKGVVCYGRDTNNEDENFAHGSVFVDLLTARQFGNCEVRFDKGLDGRIAMEKKRKPRQNSAG